MPFFSVIIPLYNKAEQIAQTINYVLAQTFTDFEIVIVNDGSTDNSLEIAKSFKDERINIYSQKNKGAGAARNFGVDKAIAEHIALLDADDIWHSNHLQCLFESISKYPNKVWYSNAYSVKHSENLIVKGNYNININEEIMQIEDFFKSSIIHPVAWTSSIVFKKSTFNSLGQFDTSLSSGEDIDLWFKFGLKHNLVFNTNYTSIYDKTVANSLSKENHLKTKYELFKSYDSKAESHSSFKHYLTIYKYALAIKCKLTNTKNIYKKLRKEIDPSYLNKKQRFILYQPVFVTKIMKEIYSFLAKNKIYLSAYN